jgi:subtilisin family serine protease
LRKHLFARAVLLAAVIALALTVVGTASAARFTVVFKVDKIAAGKAAVARAGGKVVYVNKKVGVATVRSSKSSFARTLRARTTSIAGVARLARVYQSERVAKAAAAPPGTFPDVPTVAAGCAQQYPPPGGTGFGPEPLSPCQWDMRQINASPTGSYAVNQGEGATVGIMDTGLDAGHPDLVQNIDFGLSCSFITPQNPTTMPIEKTATGKECGAAAQPKWQDYGGHGTHVGGEVAAPINGIGVSGVAPEATLVALKAGNADGWFFTQEVVNALTYAGDARLDVVNMSFFADPFWMNCKNVPEQQAIVRAISRAAQYAHQRGVVLVASAGNEFTDLDHPTTDALSPDFPPGSEEPRPVGNYCVILPGELPWVVTVSATGPQKELSFYSNYGNSKVDVTAPGGDSTQAPNPFGRVLNTWSSTAPFTAGGDPTRTLEDCAPGGGPCAYYAWVQGTSMASPHASGVAAIIRSRYPGMPPMAVGSMLQNTSMPMACTESAEARAEADCTGNTNPNAHGQTNFYGNGLVDALAAAVE